MADELDERLAQGAAELGVGGHDVGDRVDRKQHADLDGLERLQDDVLAPEARQALVPDGRQQLLHVRVGAELRPRRAHAQNGSSFKRPLLTHSSSLPNKKRQRQIWFTHCRLNASDRLRLNRL